MFQVDGSAAIESSWAGTLQANLRCLLIFQDLSAVNVTPLVKKFRNHIKRKKKKKRSYQRLGHSTPLRSLCRASCLLRDCSRGNVSKLHDVERSKCYPRRGIFAKIRQIAGLFRVNTHQSLHTCLCIPKCHSICSVACLGWRVLTPCLPDRVSGRRSGQPN